MASKRSGEREQRSLEQVLANLIEQDVEPLLVSQGFSARGQTFTRRLSLLTEYLDIEKLRWNTKHSVTFWFNVRLLVGALPAGMQATKNNLLHHTFPAYAVHMGALWGNEGDMYTILDPATAPSLSLRVRGDLGNHILPFFGQFGDHNDVIAFLVAENLKTCTRAHSFALANVLARLGRLEESERYFRESTGDPDAVRRMARSFGIEL